MSSEASCRCSLSAYWRDMSEDTDRKFDIDWLATVAGALAAVSSAVLLSTLGAAGTIIGAALGSVSVTVGSAFYRHGLARSRERLAQAQATARHKIGIAQTEVYRASRRQGDPRAEAHLSHAESSLDEARQRLESVDPQAPVFGWRERLIALPWKRISLGAAGLFTAAVLSITAFELLVGESVSSITGGSEGNGGTTISRIGGGSDRDTSREQDEDPVPSEDDAPSQTDPTEQPSDESSPSPDESSTTEEPTEEPTESTSPVPSPTDQSTPTPQPEEPTSTLPGG